MSINIKNLETTELVTRLARLTGLSLTDAVKVAVTEKLNRMITVDERIAQASAIAQDCAQRLPEWLRVAAVDDLLYDEEGMPK